MSSTCQTQLVPSLLPLWKAPLRFRRMIKGEDRKKTKKHECFTKLVDASGPELLLLLLLFPKPLANLHFLPRQCLRFLRFEANNLGTLLVSDLFRTTKQLHQYLGVVKNLGTGNSRGSQIPREKILTNFRLNAAPIVSVFFLRIQCHRPCSCAIWGWFSLRFKRLVLKIRGTGRYMESETPLILRAQNGWHCWPIEWAIQHAYETFVTNNPLSS